MCCGTLPTAIAAVSSGRPLQPRPAPPHPPVRWRPHRSPPWSALQHWPHILNQHPLAARLSKHAGFAHSVPGARWAPLAEASPASSLAVCCLHRSSFCSRRRSCAAWLRPPLLLEGACRKQTQARVPVSTPPDNEGEQKINAKANQNKKDKHPT